MKSLISQKIAVVILLLIASCSNLNNSPNLSSQKIATSENSDLVIIAPEIPFANSDAFYPLRRSEDGSIHPSYQWRECASRFIICTEWRMKSVEFRDLEWFMANGFGLTKRKRPVK